MSARRRWARVGLIVTVALALAVAGWVRVQQHEYGELVTDPARVDGAWAPVEVWGDYSPSDGIYVGLSGDRWQIAIGDGCNDAIGYLDIAPDGTIDVGIRPQASQMMCHGWDRVDNLAAVEAAATIWLDGSTVRLVHADGWVLATYWRDPDN